jgi:hypothetical protein
VSQCSTETLFDDLFGDDALTQGSVPTEPTNDYADLIKFADNFLKSHKMMNTHQLAKWRDRRKEFQQMTPEKNKHWTPEERKKRNEKLAQMHHENEKYKKMLCMAREEWMLTTDGIVHALSYNPKEKIFVAKVRYTKGEDVKNETMNVTDDWVLDTYGKNIANKVIHCTENESFITSLNQNGELATVKVDDRRICGLRYHPPKFRHVYEDKKLRRFLYV